MTRHVSFTFTAPTGLDPSLLPLYSGKLLVKSSNGDQLAVPYQGLGFNLNGEMESIFAGKYPLLRAGFPPKDATMYVTPSDVLLTPLDRESRRSVA